MLTGVIGDDATIQTIRARAARLIAAERLPPIMIQGETGTGKTLLARELHGSSPRSSAPFVSVNCAAIPESLLESELFGIERGAFTDARESKPGLLQSAHLGTLFLDEIGYLPVRLQPKLLTVIEEWSIRRLGSTRTEPIDVWLIAATSEDLERAITEQRFLRALYHRLAVMTFHMPPLRERANDLPRLAERLLTNACRTYGLPQKRLQPAAIAELRRYSWPGNVRELANVIERAALLGDGIEVTAAMLAMPSETKQATSASSRYRKKSEGERAELERALSESHGNVSEAARLLGVPRNTLRYRLRRHGLLSEPQVPAEEMTLEEPAPATAPAPVRWEKQKVAFLTARIASSDDPRSSGWLDVLDEKIDVFGGRILERDEQRMAAVFGLGAVEDGARRAASAALTTLQAGLGAPPAFCVEIDDVAIARVDGDIMIGPDALGRARAAVALRADNGVWLGEAAAQAVRRHFRITSREGRPFIDAEHSAPIGAHAGAIVGRTGELALLASRAEIALGGTGQIVGLVGPPGIGKSRLVGELRAQLPPSRFQTIDASCAAHASAIPYYPIAQIVRRIGTADADAADAPYLLHVLGVDSPSEQVGSLGAETIRDRAFAAVRKLLLRSAAVQPLVVIIEDVHWADPSSRELLEFLVEGMGRAPLLLLVTYRPDSEPGIMARSFSTRIALARLSADDSRGLVARVLAPEQSALVESIVERAEGNPLFLEELALAVRSGASILGVPDSLHGILRVRMERLDAAERRLMQVASVLGRAFDRSLLEAVWDGPEPLDPLFAALDRADLLYLSGGAYLFKHALTRDVAYETLVDSERARLHERAAGALETVHRENRSEACELIAYHYALSTNHEKALEYLMQAQAKTYRRFALDQALRYFEEARARLDAMPENEINLRRRIELLICHCDAIGYLTRLDDYRSHLEVAVALAQRLGDPRVITSTRARQGYMYWWTGGYAEAIEVLEPNLRFAPDSTPEEFNSGVWLLNAYLVVGRYTSAVELAPRIIEKLVARGSVIHKAYALGAFSWALTECGRFSEALRHTEASLAGAQAAGDPAAVSFAAWSSSRVYALIGDLSRAGELAELSVTSSRTPLDQIFSPMARGWVGCLAGRGEPALHEVVTSFEQVRAAKWQMPGGWLALPDAYAALGRWDDARRSLEEHLERATKHGMWGTAAGVRRRLGEVALRTGDLIAARTWLEEALAAFDRMGAMYERALAIALLGEVALSSGSSEAGRTQLAEALGLLESMGVKSEAARVRALLATR